MAEQKAVGVEAQGPAQHAPQAEKHDGGQDKRGPPPRVVPPIDETPHGGLPQRDGHSEHDDAPSRSTERGASWDAKGVIDVLTLIVTGLVALGTILLWWATRQLVVGADKNAARQLRAYVGLEDLFVADREPQGGARKLTVKIRNFGQVPAKDVSIAFTWTDLRKGHGLQPETIARYDQTVFALMPGAVEEIGRLHTTRLLLTNSVVVGRITYEDGFGQKRFTDLRLLSRPSSDRFARDTYGNDAD